MQPETTAMERVAAIQRHLMSRLAAADLDDEEWIVLGTPCVIVGAGNGRAFCAGGDIELCIVNISQPETRADGMDADVLDPRYELDYILTNMPLPYIVIMDGATMGAGAGLTAGAAFRIATEHTVFAMPEVQIGYCPDVGCSHFLTRADGEIGTYLALTSESLQGQSVYEHGFATHYILSENIPNGLRSHLSGGIRAALDSAFRYHTVEQIVEELTQYAKHSADQDVRRWAARTLKTLSTRSPTSLKVSLALLRRGKNMPLLDALQMELNMTTAYCNGSDPNIFVGSNAMLDGQLGQRLPWYPDTLEKVSDTYIQENFFPKYSPDKGTAP
ncbi:ClpP/crotonase [Wolfiporia cocos MD-104 SS10]|uniref:3-hydroxyisobutyryl-CoA hydrolase n=1 Tax=Wolfiporia cocos (strain MD-104) TaxID=742152 RepID=A0A2H3J933_WOLCO|nr:ClpP/crotonase [Wolfiporia cocos MD-104 SS10]